MGKTRRSLRRLFGPHHEGSSASHYEGSSLPSTSPSSPPSLPTASFSSLSLDSLNLRIQKLDPADQIEPLISFIEYQLQRIKGSSDEAFSSSLLTSVASNTSLAAQFIDSITKQAESLASTDIAKEMGNIALSGLKKVGEAHWVFLGLSVAACALERCATMRSNAPDCIDLLQAIVYLAKDLKLFKKQMRDEGERLRQPVQIIVEGAIMCCDYINKGRLSRYWSATTTQAQLEKTNKSINEIRTSLAFPVNLVALQNIKELLQTTTKRLEESPLKLLEFEPVGIEEKVEKVKALLDMEGTEPVRVVILCGFGGVGKSTLAASVVQNMNWSHLRASADFKFCRVIITDNGADAKKLDEALIMKLQEDIIYDFGGGRQDLRNPQEGRGRLQEVIANKTCLLFIDNVVDKKYVQDLLPKDLLWFNKSENMSMGNLGKPKTKLRILITSREKNLKPEFNVPCEEDDVHVFSDETARRLLRKTILCNDAEFSADFEEIALMNAVADACRGVPILLSVFGKHLRYDRKPENYKEALESLFQGNLDSFADEDLSKQLFFVYRKLREEDQEAFLDICKYFYGWKWDLVCKILDEGRVKTLQKKMLINKSDSGIVIVHDILRLMGEKEAKLTRISNYRELSVVLKDGEKRLEEVKGISLDGNESLIPVETRHLNATCKSLRVLMVGDRVKFHGPPCNQDFQNLRYLSVGDTSNFPFEETSKLQKLAAFFNRSKHSINPNWLPPSLKIISYHVPHPNGHSFEILPLQNLRSLQSFILETRMLVKLPQEFVFPASLVDLQLNCCGQLPKEISNLTALEHLTLDKCDFQFLPQGMGKLKNLKLLSLQHCTKLASLPEELGLLSSMTCLMLCGCTLLQTLPENLGNLSALEELNMRECENLRKLPQGFGGLCSLHKLDLSGCIALKTLPESFAQLRIESLTLESLLSLDELPSCFGNMPRLSHLQLISCDSLSTLPNSFVHLKCLQTLQIRNCSRIVGLPGGFGQLGVLSIITLEKCPKLEELPDGFEELRALKHLELKDCSSLVNLPSGFGEIICLEYLWLKGLSISSLPDGFGNLKRLGILIIELCYRLETLPKGFETLPSLTLVKFLNCSMLDGSAMDRIIKLQQCYYSHVAESGKLIERWRQIREEDESPMAVCTEPNFLDDAELERAAKVSLLCGKCVEWDNSTEQLIERPTSMLFEEDTTVALIALPLHIKFQHQQFIAEAMERAKMASQRGRLRVVYVKRVNDKGETTEQEKEEEDCFRKVLRSMPEGSSALPSTDMRRHYLISYLFFNCAGYRADNKLACCVVNIQVNDKDHKFVKFKDSFGEDDISGEALQLSQNSDKKDVISNKDFDSWDFRSEKVSKVRKSRVKKLKLKREKMVQEHSDNEHNISNEDYDNWDIRSEKVRKESKMMRKLRVKEHSGKQAISTRQKYWFISFSLILVCFVWLMLR